MPGNAGKGRPKGVPNRISAELRAIVLTALEDAGGAAYLARVAEQHPVAFLTLLGRLLPLEARFSASGSDAPGFMINIDLHDDQRPVQRVTPQVEDLDHAKHTAGH